MLLIHVIVVMEISQYSSSCVGHVSTVMTIGWIAVIWRNKHVEFWVGSIFWRWFAASVISLHWSRGGTILNFKLTEVRKEGLCYCYSYSLKPVLNWANVCSLNILQTVQRTMIRFLIELLVHWTCFGQFEEFTCSQLVCNEMQASAWTCGRGAADSMNENVG